MSNEEEKIIPPEAPTHRTLKSVFIFLLLIIVAAFAFMLVQLFNIQQQVASLTQESQELSQASTTLQKKSIATETDADALRQDMQRLGEKINQVAQLSQTKQAAGSIADAHYLIKLANQVVRFEKNPELAATILKSADQEIQSISDPKLDTLRQTLAQDITALQQVPRVDISGWYMKLSALNTKLDELPLIDKPNGKESVATTVDPNASWWLRGLQTTWQALRQIIVVRHYSTNQLPFIAPDQQAFVYQNLHAELMQAKWALLHGQDDIYRQNLQALTIQIGQYFNKESALTMDVLKQLTELQQVTLQEAMPATLHSLQAVEQIGH